ncbi:MAG: efflux RND transporter periplasmic adaptor subunit [Verrucomicrobia bacterium]|nr:efflux RND transporter periplasmic adaptor subunit [Verrucomicrobiota bacterium]
MAKSKSKKGRKIVIFSVIVLAVGGLSALAFFKKREVPIMIQTEKVGRRNITELVVANGRIQPVVQVKISPEVSGEIIALPVKEGYKVKKGDLLLKIKPDFYIANRNSSEASYLGSLAGKTTAAASLQKAEAELKRNQELFDKKLISESVFLEISTTHEIAKAQLESATRQVDMAKAALDRAKEDLRKTEIYSPIDGTVSKLNSQLGERVVGTAMMAGTEVLIVADLNEMEARVDVNEIDVVLIQIGQKARLEVDAFRDKKFNGLVTEIANSSRGAGMPGMGGGGGGGQSQEATKFEVRIRVSEKEAFRPGMSVSSEIETRSRNNVLSVPIASVTTRLPKEPAKPGDKKKGAQANEPDCLTNTVAGGATNTIAVGTTNALATSTTNSPANTTNSTQTVEKKKPNEPPKPIEVVFLKNSERAKMVSVKRGISDDSYVEITEGLNEGDEVVSGGYKAISKDLEDGKKVKIGSPKGEKDKEKK